jgi:predicted MPP superfamily phosphohydrolase
MTFRLRAILLALAVAIATFTFARTNGAANRGPLQDAGKRDAESVRFIAFGDMGTGDREQYALARRMAAWHDESGFDTVLLLGDNIYPDGDPALLPAKFEKPYAELLRRGVRFYASLGNHDVKRGREAQINYPNFNMGGRAYYSFTKTDKTGGVVEFFALDSTNVDAGQLQWLEGALAASKATWKLAFFHHPIYSSARTHGSDTRLRAKLEPLFVRYGVAAVFSGHDHTYERIKPQQGVQYFVAGAASGKLRRGDINRQSRVFAAGNDETGSFLAVEARRDALIYRAIDVNGNLLDSGALAPVAAKSTSLSISTPLWVPSLARDGKPAPSMNGDPSAGVDRNERDAPATESEKEARKREEKERRKTEKEEKRAREKEEKELKKKQKDSTEVGIYSPREISTTRPHLSSVHLPFITL